MKYVYLIRSNAHPNQRYIGITSDLEKRLSVHSSGGSVHTSKFKPWKLITSLAFSEDSKALAFERYLKTGSGTSLRQEKIMVIGIFPLHGATGATRKRLLFRPAGKGNPTKA